MDTYDQRIQQVLLNLLHYLERYEKARDGRATFTYVYLLTTSLFVNAKDQFDDPYWVSRFVREFSQEFIDATEAYDNNEPVSNGWIEVFDTVTLKRTSVLEEMLYGMASHMVHDLPVVLTKVGMVDPAKNSRIADFDRISDLLVSAIDLIQKEVAERYNPFLGWLDRLTHRKDEFITKNGMRITRGIAWFNANRLQDPINYEKVKIKIERFPGILIRKSRKRFIVSLFRFVSSFSRRWP
ncbi:hypothetical protein HOC32_04615 [Candidatus Woesearchaeota archaeon]|nr:hypothetical protein [Candidatus Woesearchaeota archaeon]